VEYIYQFQIFALFPAYLTKRDTQITSILIDLESTHQYLHDDIGIMWVREGSGMGCD